MTYKTVVLPERDDMLGRLKGAIDEPHIEQGFYSLLLAHAGEEKAAPEGVAMMLVLAMADYATGLPEVMWRTLNVALPRFIAALVDDEDVRRETLEFIQSVQ